jgi:Xaa-Pro aminopeptidase
MNTRHYEGHRKTRRVMREHYPRFSDAEYERRYGLVRGLMDEQGLDCLLVYGDSALNSLQSLNCHWLSNYFDEQNSYVIVPRNGDPIVYTSIPADVPAAMAASPIDDVRPGGVGRGMAATVAGDLAKLGKIGRLGLVDNFATAPGLPYVHHQILTAELPGTEIVPVAREYEALKASPSEEEMEWFRKGVELTDVAWERLVEAIEPGRTEAELLAILHTAYLEEGGAYCFAILGSTPMSDPALSYPHAIPSQPSRRALEQGDYILCELSASYYGYSGQNFCAVTLGEPTVELAEMAALSREVHDDLAVAIRDGATDLDVTALTSRIRERGYDSIAPAVHAWGTHFGHPVIGVDSSWSPWSVTFQTGQLVVIQPHVVTLDATLGFEIGALAQVGPDGTTMLHRHGTELVVKN